MALKRQHSDSEIDGLVEDEINLRCDETLEVHQVNATPVEKFYNTISIRDRTNTVDFVTIAKDEFVTEMIKLLNDNDVSETPLNNESDLINFSKREDFDIYSMMAFTFVVLYKRKFNDEDSGDMKLINFCIRFIEDYKKDAIRYFNDFKNLICSGSYIDHNIIKKPKFLMKKTKHNNTNANSNSASNDIISIVQQYVDVFGKLHVDICQKVTFASRETLAIKSHTEKLGKFHKIDDNEPLTECVEFNFTRKILLKLERNMTNNNTLITNVSEGDKGVLLDFVNSNIQCSQGLNLSNLVKLCSYKDISIMHTYKRFKVTKTIEDYNNAYVIISGFQLSNLIQIGNFAPQNIIKIYPLKLTLPGKDTKISMFDFTYNDEWL